MTRRYRPGPIRRIPAAETRTLLRGILEAAAESGRLDPGALKSAPFSRIRSLPSWVRRCGFLQGHGRIFMWCESEPGPGETFSGQFVLDVPPGRYFIEIFDTGAHAWVSRESAEGGPLVAGLPFAGNPLFVSVRPFPGG
jgi:hypothetical protein